MMRRFAAVAALAVAAGFAARPVQAADLEFYTGTSLYAQCAAPASDPEYAAKQARCGGYVLGVSDAQQAAQGAGAASKVCITAAAGSPQLVQAVTQFLAAHVEKRPLAAQDLVIEALAAQFPCR